MIVPQISRDLVSICIWRLLQSTNLFHIRNNKLILTQFFWGGKDNGDVEQKILEARREKQQQPQPKYERSLGFDLGTQCWEAEALNNAQEHHCLK